MRLLADIWSSEVVYRLGWALLHTLWLGLAVALVLACVLAALRRRSANARYVVACAALGLMAALPIAAYLATPAPTRAPTAETAAHPERMPIEATAPQRATIVAGAAEADARQVAPVGSIDAGGPAMPEGRAARADPPGAAATAANAPATDAPAETGHASLIDHAMRTVEPALPWIVAAWIVGAFALSLLHLCGWSLARRMTRLDVRPVGREIAAIADELALAMGLPRPVEVLESMRVAAPAVIGHLRPVILVPVALATGLTREQLRAILAHELAHVRRRDYLVNLLQTLVETVLFYHPAAWYVSRRIRIEREHCCDDAALGAGAERLSYAESLLHLAGRSAGMAGAPAPAVAAAGRGGRSQLRCRIARMLGRADETARVSCTWPIALVVMVALIAAVVVPLSIMQAATNDDKPTATKAVEEESDTQQVEERAEALLARISRTWQPGFAGALLVSSYRPMAAKIDSREVLGWVQVLASRGGRYTLSKISKQADVQLLLKLGPDAAKVCNRALAKAQPGKNATTLVALLGFVGDEKSVPLLIDMLAKSGKIQSKGWVTYTATTWALWRLTGRKLLMTSKGWARWWQAVGEGFRLPKDRAGVKVTEGRVRPLVAELSRKDDELVRERLVALGVNAVPHLTKAMQAASGDVRYRLAWVIDETGRTQDIPPDIRRTYFIQRLGQERQSSRLLAKEARTRALTEQSFEDFCRTALQVDYEPKKLASEEHFKGALNRKDVDLGAAIPVLVRALEGPDAGARARGAKLAAIVGSFSGATPAKLIDALERRWLGKPGDATIMYALSRFDTPGVRRVIAEGLHSDDEKVIRACLAVAADTSLVSAEKAKEIGERLAALTSHKEVEVRIGSARVLALRAPALLRPHLERLCRDNPEIGRHCAAAMGQLKDPDHAQLLVSLAASTDPIARNNALKALGNAAFRKAIPSLVPLLWRSGHGYNDPCMWTIAKAGGPEAVAVLVGEVGKGKTCGGTIYDALEKVTGKRFKTPEQVLLWWWAGGLEAPAIKRVSLSDRQLDVLWGQLDSVSLLKGHQAIVSMRAGGQGAVAFLARRLRPVSADADRIATLIRQLDSDEWPVRQNASAELSLIGPAAQAALRAASKGKLSVEARPRVSKLLEACSRPYPVLPEAMRVARAIRILELIAAPQAAAVLKKLTKGTPRAHATQRAQAALKRMAGAPTPATPPAKVDLGRDRLKIEFNPPDTLPGGLYVVGPFDRAWGQSPDAHLLYQWRIEKKIGDGYEQLVGRLPLAVYGHGVKGGGAVETLEFARSGNRIVGTLKYTYPPRGAKLKAHSAYLRAFLPKLPLGQYEVEIRFEEHYRTGDGKVVPAPKGSRPRIPAMTCRFKVLAGRPATRATRADGENYDYENSAPLRKAMLPLLKAVGQGDLAAVKKIIEARGELAKAKCPPSGSSYGVLGVWAALDGRWQSGWHIDFDGATALHFAADMGRREVAAYLLKKGAAINARDRRGRTPLHCVAVLGRAPRKGAHWAHKTLAEAVRQRQALIRRREVLAPFLLAKGADINAVDREGDTPLAAAARTDNPTIAKLLLAGGAKLDIFSAIRLGMLDRVKTMLKAEPACTNLPGGPDASPLHVAAELADPAAASLLLDHGAKLGVGKYGDTPLGRAVRAGHTETARTLLAAGAKPNQSKCWGEPVLNYAAREGHLEIVKLLFARGAKLEAVDSDNCTALFDAAYAGQMAVVTFLLDKGADVNGGAKRGNSPLRGVTYLTQVDHEVDPSGVRRERMKKMAAFLIARGAKVDVLSASGLGLLDRLRAILKADPASVHFTGTDGKWPQPLIWAARRKQLAAAKLLLDAGANVNAPSPWSNSTALHHAAGAGDIEMCTLLLNRGANVRATTEQKTTPLHSAMYRNENAPVVKLLLDRGADPNTKGPTSCHRTPLDVARSCGHDDLVRLVLLHVKASTGKDRSRRPSDPEKRYPANTEPVEIKNAFAKANPNYKQRTGAYYEKEYLAPAAGQIAQAAKLDEQEKAVARAILRAFIYDWLDSTVRGGGKITQATLQKHLAVMDGCFGAELSKEKFDLYLVWRKGRPPVGNSLLFLMRPESAVTDKHKKIRAAAARIRTKYPKCGEAMWKALAALVKPGMTVEAMKVVLPPAAPETYGSPSGRLFTVTYPLDTNFAVEASGQWVAVAQNDHMSISTAPTITKRQSNGGAVPEGNSRKVP